MFLIQKDLFMSVWTHSKMARLRSYYKYEQALLLNTRLYRSLWLILETEERRQGMGNRGKERAVRTEGVNENKNHPGLSTSFPPAWMINEGTIAGLPILAAEWPPGWPQPSSAQVYFPHVCMGLTAGGQKRHRPRGSGVQQPELRSKWPSRMALHAWPTTSPGAGCQSQAERIPRKAVGTSLSCSNSLQ